MSPRWPSGMQLKRWTVCWGLEFNGSRRKERATLETMGFPGGLRVISDTISTFLKVITLGRRSGRTAHSRQSEKCRREAIWLDEKPYRRSCLVVSTPEFDPDSGQTKMGQIWVNSQKKAKTTPEPQGSEVVLSCQFSRKNSAAYTKDTAKLVGCAGSIPQKSKKRPQVTKPGVFGCGGRI